MTNGRPDNHLTFVERVLYNWLTWLALVLALVGLGMMNGVHNGTVPAKDTLQRQTGDIFNSGQVDSEGVWKFRSSGERWLYPVGAPHYAQVKQLLIGNPTDPHLVLEGTMTSGNVCILAVSDGARPVVTYDESAAFYANERSLQNLPLGIALLVAAAVMVACIAFSARRGT